MISPIGFGLFPPNWRVQYIHTYIHTYIYIYIESERERERERDFALHSFVSRIEFITLDGLHLNWLICFVNRKNLGTIFWV